MSVVVPIARKGLLEDTPINDLLLDEAAELCADVVDLRNHDAGWRVAVDIATWRTPDFKRIELAFKSRSLELGEIPFIPVIGASEWAPMNGAYEWRATDLKFLSPEAMAKIGARIMDPELGSRRIERLEALNQALFDCGLSPDDETLATWIEKVALSMDADTSRTSPRGLSSTTISRRLTASSQI